MSGVPVPPVRSKPLPPSPLSSPRTSPRGSPSPRTGRRVFGKPWALKSAHAIALYKFEGDDVRLPLNPGDRLRVEEEGYGWYKGLNMETDCTGIFPCEYVALQPEGVRDNDAVPTATDETVVRASQALREWGTLMNAWMRDHRFDKAKAIRSHIVAVLKAKSAFMDEKTKPEERKPLRKFIRQALVKCTAELGLHLTVSSADGVYADALNTNTLELYRMYCAADSGHLASTTSSAEAPRALTMAPGASSIGKKDMGAEMRGAGLVQVFLKCYNAFICKVDEENDSAVQLLFSLYSLQKKADVTESYAVNLTSRLMVQDLERIDLQKTIFANVELADTLLVCRIVRVGKISARQKAATRYRIPFGVAVVPISVVLKEKNSRFASQLPIYRLESGCFATLTERIVRGEVTANPGSGVAVEICVYNSALDSLHEEVEDFARLSVTNMLVMDPANLRPGMVRNDFYVIVQRGEMQQEGKKTAKNVEVTLSVRLDDGTLVPGCLTGGVSEAPVDEYRSTVYYHDNQPTWDEPVRVDVDPKLLPRCHVLVECRHCTTKDEKKGKLFSLGSLPLTSAMGTIIENSTYSVTLYKPLVKPKDVAYYLQPDANGLKASREFVWLGTSLASTKMIQNVALYKLLHWESFESELMEVLKRFTFVDTIDLVKVLSDLLPALFSMMDGRSDLRMYIFDALSYLIALLVTGRFDAFAPIVDEYFDSNFRDPNSYHHILSCLTQYFRNFSDPSMAKQFREALRGLQYWFKIITKSKAAETLSPDPEQFVRELESLLTLVNQLLCSKDRSNVGAQMLTLKAFDDLLFRSIAPFFADDRFSRLLLNLLGSLEYDDARPKVNMEKLVVIQSMLVGPSVMERPAVRDAVLPAMLSEIHLHLGKSTAEFGKCMELLAVIFSKLQVQMRLEGLRAMPFARECAGFVPHLTHAVAKLKPSAGLDHDIVAFLTLFAILPKDSVEAFFNSLAGPKAKDLLTQVLHTLMYLLKKSLPRNWFSLSAFQAQVIVRILKVFRPILLGRIKSFPKEIALWTAFLELMFALIVVPQLQIEHLTESKRQLMLRRYGDLRVEAALVLRKTWHELKVLQSIFVPKFVSQFLNLVMLKQPDVREIGVEMYWSVLWREIEETGEFKTVGSATIDTVNQLSQDDDAPIDFVDFEEFFLRSCRERLAAVKGPSPQRHAVGQQFLHEISSLLQLVRRVKTLPPGPEFEEERITATMDLMSYLRSTERPEIFVRYVQQLSDMLGESGNFVEAGMALMLHADMLEWSDALVPPVGPYPEETKCARKEKLLLAVAELFSNAKHWERAIPLLQEVAQRYERVTYQYEPLATLLHKVGDMYRLIATSQRFYANYFRVAFYGLGFGESVRGKQFIYKGFELESLPDFTARLQQVYRKAEVLKTTTISADVEAGEGQYLLITAVTPSCVEELHGKKRVFDAAMPMVTQRFHEANGVSHFVYSKPTKAECVAVGEVEPQIREFASLWVKKFFMVTAEPFPSYYKRMVVVQLHEKDVSPIQNAVADMEGKNQSLVQLTAQAQRDRDPNQLGPLSMLLNGVLDAAVNGGTNIYLKLFLVPAYAAARPADAPLCETLRELMVQQVELVSPALKLHRQLCPESLQPLQEKMDGFFHTLEQTMSAYGYVPKEQPAPAVLEAPRRDSEVSPVEAPPGALRASAATAVPSATSAPSSAAAAAAAAKKPRPTAVTMGSQPGTTELRKQKSNGAIAASSSAAKDAAQTPSSPVASPRTATTAASPRAAGGPLPSPRSGSPAGAALAGSGNNLADDERKKNLSFGTLRKKSLNPK